MLSELAEEEEGAAAEAEGCSEGEEGGSCPPVPGKYSQLAGKDVPGAKQPHLALFPRTETLCFHSWFRLKSFFLLHCYTRPI